MRFSDPYWLIAGVLACAALAALWRWRDRQRQAALELFLAPHLKEKLTRSVSAVRLWVQRGLFLTSVLLLFTALAGPQLGYHWEAVVRRGNEVVFAIDTSRSMLTPDVKPDRLTRAKLAIDDMARQLEGDGVGIVAFAGSAFLVCPLTLDQGAFHQSLDAIDIHTIPHGGTNIPTAIAAARAALRYRPGSDRILILVTDGENLEGDALKAAQEAAQQDGLKIYTIGVGTGAGELIPLPPEQGGGVVKDEKGVPVTSHLDEAGLKAIAAATGGAYAHLEGQGDDFETFLKTVFGAVSKHDLLYRARRIYNERYQWPLAASLAMLLAGLMMDLRRSKSRRARALARATATTSALLATLLLTARSHGADQPTPPAAPPDSKLPRLQFNSGAAAYRAGQFSQATQAFQGSIKTAPSADARRLADQEDAYYNLGNALYRLGQQSEKSAPQEAIRQWTAAVKAYDTALELRPDDADSRFNRDFVQRKIDALQQPPNPSGGGGAGGGGGQGGGHGGQGRGQGQPPPPQGQGQPPPGQGQLPKGQGGQGQPPPQGAGAGSKQQPSGSQQGAAIPRAPGQMSAEEARGLLDSAKSDERHSPLVPLGMGKPPQDKDKPFKDW